ncbi:hypothetical protein ACFOOM_22175 [Streptomyces echinoruber]|uniref:Uncharacterized protein n=1 Tax=Streptomyces echinoruber TaxID=68898 RepID=A0A918R0V3_9ACTN|nr:hypothetical protein [Streptomyces echinoruber]GGZ81943.1 hypothetical protein GCM10010389_19770 [Streptomyces echinoruber]
MRVRDRVVGVTGASSGTGAAHGGWDGHRRTTLRRVATAAALAGVTVGARP